MVNGYIYVRNHYAYEIYNAYKLGRTSNYISRDFVYASGEIKRGNYKMIIKVKNEILVEKILQNHFKFLNLHIYENAGKEFYNIKILDLIIPLLNSYGIKYKFLSKSNMNKLIKNNYKKYKNTKLTKNEINIFIKENYNEIIKQLKKPNKKYKNIKINKINNYKDYNIKPYKEQINVLNNINKFYKNNKIGKILWSCGLGKTLLSIFICKKLNVKKIIIGVPTIYLQNQFYSEILKIFPNDENIIFIGGDNDKTTNDIKDIILFLNKKTNKQLFIITTYASCNLLVDNNIDVDFKIGDEAHHLTGVETKKGYKEFHKIKSKNTLFMTATEKIIETKLNKIIYSMKDTNIFGNLIDEKTVMWAIEHKKITDYNLLIISNTEDEIIQIINNLQINIINKELFMSAFMALKSIEKYNDLTHILICCNSTENSEIINNYLHLILNKNIMNIDKNDIYLNALHSNKKINIDLNNDNNEINKFKNSKYGIISSVYLFSEGFDLPKLNGVVFGENMLSDIRILQTSLRPNRLDKLFPNKKAYIIIPYIEYDDYIEDNKSFNKVKIIVSKLRNEDKIIEQKIIITKIVDVINNKNNEQQININNNLYLEDKKDEFNKIKLRLKYSKSLNSKLSSEQDEYNYVKIINKELNIDSKIMYASNTIKSIHNNYIHEPEQYFTLKGVWVSWYDFLNINETIFLKTIDSWRNFCFDLKIDSLHSYDEATKKYKCLPKFPSEYYKEFTNISIELKFLIIRR